MKKLENIAEYIEIGKLKELENNPRIIKKADFEKLKTSIKNNPEFFEAHPIIVSDRTGENVIIAGNQRWKAAQSLGMNEVPVVILHGLDEEKEKEIIIRSNVENGDWDFDILANEWDEELLDDWGVSVPKMVNADGELEEENDDEPEASRVVICSVDVFGRSKDDDAVLVSDLSQEIADKVLAAVKEQGSQVVAGKIIEALNALFSYSNATINTGGVYEALGFESKKIDQGQPFVIMEDFSIVRLITLFPYSTDYYLAKAGRMKSHIGGNKLWIKHL